MEKSSLKIYLKKGFASPWRGSVWFRSCSHQCRRYAGQNRASSPALAAAALKEGSSWAKPSSWPRTSFQVCKSAHLLNC